MLVCVLEEAQRQPPGDDCQRRQHRAYAVLNVRQAELAHRLLEEELDFAAVRGGHREAVADAFDEVGRVVEDVGLADRPDGAGLEEVDADESVDADDPVRTGVCGADPGLMFAVEDDA